MTRSGRSLSTASDEVCDIETQLPCRARRRGRCCAREASCAAACPAEFAPLDDDGRLVTRNARRRRMRMVRPAPRTRSGRCLGLQLAPEGSRSLTRGPGADVADRRQRSTRTSHAVRYAISDRAVKLDALTSRGAPGGASQLRGAPCLRFRQEARGSSRFVVALPGLPPGAHCSARTLACLPAPRSGACQPPGPAPEHDEVEQRSRPLGRKAEHRRTCAGDGCAHIGASVRATGVPTADCSHRACGALESVRGPPEHRQQVSLSRSRTRNASREPRGDEDADDRTHSASCHSRRAIRLKTARRTSGPSERHSA